MEARQPPEYDIGLLLVLAHPSGLRAAGTRGSGLRAPATSRRTRARPGSSRHARKFYIADNRLAVQPVVTGQYQCAVVDSSNAASPTETWKSTLRRREEQRRQKPVESASTRQRTGGFSRRLRLNSAYGERRWEASERRPARLPLPTHPPPARDPARPREKRDLSG